jgi:hypothetical protein
MTRAVNVMRHDEMNARPPGEIGPLVAKILRSSSPRLRYVCGPFLQQLSTILRWVLPAQVFEWSIRSYYQLDARAFGLTTVEKSSWNRRQRS